MNEPFIDSIKIIMRIEGLLPTVKLLLVSLGCHCNRRPLSVNGVSDVGYLS